MTVQRDLWDPTRARHGGNAESRAAWQQAAEHQESVKEQVLAFIVSRGSEGATLDEIAVHFGKTPNAVSGRVTSLRKEKRIAWKLGCWRETRSKCRAKVWIAFGS